MTFHKLTLLVSALVATSQGLPQYAASNGVELMAVGPTEVCLEPVRIGPCRALLERFAFDVATSQCRPFLYGGCGGSGNNFETEQECNNVCLYNEKRSVDCPEVKQCPQYCQITQDAETGCDSCQCPDTPAEVCGQAIEGGLCRGSFLQFAFDLTTGECRSFTYGGCGGNANRFDKLEQCKAFCQFPSPAF